MSVQKENSYQLGCRPGEQGPLHEVRGLPSVVTASTSKTVLEVRGAYVSLVDAGTSVTQEEDTGLSRASATNNSRPKQHRRSNSICKFNCNYCLVNMSYLSLTWCLDIVLLENIQSYRLRKGPNFREQNNMRSMSETVGGGTT